MIIKVLEKTEGCLPEVFEKGDWIDLKTACDVKIGYPFALNKYTRKGQEREYQRKVMFEFRVIPLGVCIEVPKGYECIIAPRSSTFGKYGVLQSNSIGVIDQTYCSDKDEWKMPVLGTKECFIPKGTRIAQFRVQLSQKASLWQKIKWLFNSSVTIQKVDSLNNEERKGFGEGTKDKQ